MVGVVALCLLVINLYLAYSPLKKDRKERFI
jgi:hypothetical protein